MVITFDNEKLRKLAEDFKVCQKIMGERRAKLFHMRLGQMSNVHSLEDVRNLPGRFHELTGDRKGQWACDLDHPFRLIFTPHEKPLPVDKSGRTLWSEIHGVEIVEIIDYH